MLDRVSACSTVTASAKLIYSATRYAHTGENKTRTRGLTKLARQDNESKKNNRDRFHSDIRLCTQYDRLHVTAGPRQQLSFRKEKTKQKKHRATEGRTYGPTDERTHPFIEVVAHTSSYMRHLASRNQLMHQRNGTSSAFANGFFVIRHYQFIRPIG